MIVLIDAYNFLKYELGNRRISERERRALCRRMELYAEDRECRVIIIFDGEGDDDGWVGAYCRSYYSGAKKSADDTIREYCDRFGSLKGKVASLILFSSDRELRSYARRRGITSVDVGTAWDLVRETPAGKQVVTKSRGPAVKKPDGESNEELDMLMERFS